MEVARFKLGVLLTYWYFTCLETSDIYLPIDSLFFFNKQNDSFKWALNSYLLGLLLSVTKNMQKYSKSILYFSSNSWFVWSTRRSYTNVDFIFKILYRFTIFFFFYQVLSFIHFHYHYICMRINVNVFKNIMYIFYLFLYSCADLLTKHGRCVCALG